ncbi:MAG: HNH endonuclease [Nanoarchaeota archaeon]|nr:HNH endonuclease [Nanoarchaeota archaeon]
MIKRKLHSKFDVGFKIPKMDVFDYNKAGKKVRAKISITMQKEIFIRAKGKCENRSCKKPLKGLRPHIHHKDKKPNNNKKSNLILLCPNCHSRKHLKDKPKKPERRKNPYSLW